jgi:hypothetical protein
MADPKQDVRPSDTAEPGGPPKAATVAREDRLDEQGVDSFPASDPHSDWAGPPP